MQSHILHKYERVIKEGKKSIYKCIIPKCLFYKRYELLLNTAAICWRCGYEMILTKHALKMKRPKHALRDCMKHKEVGSEKAIYSILNSLMGEKNDETI